MKRTTKSLRQAKGNSQIVCITAYDTVTARLADAADVDVILVGDSVGNVVLGFDSTVPVTADMMVHHTAAVARARPNALIAADIPFGVAHGEFSELLKICMRLMQEGGAEAVKIEGGIEMAPTIARLTAAGVPVWAHIGLQAQNVYQEGGYRKFGKTEDEKSALLAAARAHEKAGAFALLLEMMVPELAGEITENASVPTVGIGSGTACDGQIIVMHDILGLSPKKPSFAKVYAELGSQAVAAISAYRDDVRRN
ncbi:MAG: 3-methyl-2-oxobutanoate hydroxymethyltransferase [Verrucomicrobia bacterium]|nr:3-methyl-2-oxobutanoate hydroxymethyltransferase [Verrucomicrobiota bacterium]